MKRPLQLLGLFLPLLETTKSEALHLQYHVQPSQRSVQYTSKSNIPPNSNILYGTTESKTQKYNEQQSKEFFLLEEEQYDDGWYLHVDATYEHPDEILKQVLNKKNDYYVGHSEATKKTLFRWWQDDTVNNRPLQLRTDLRNRFLSSEDDVIPESVAVEYTVSVETEHNVVLESGETTASGGVSNNTSSATSSSQHQNDSSTVLFISTNTSTSGENTTTSNSNNSSSSNTSTVDNEAVHSNSTNNDKKSQFRPLRFRSFLSNVEGGGIHLTSYQRSILLQDIMKPALLSWSTALRVDPVIGNLTVDRNQLVDGKLCGPGGDLPSFPVPTAHMTMGVPDTDFILYIHLAFVSSKTNNSVLSDSTMEDSMNVTDTLNNSTIDDVKVNYNNSSTGNPSSTNVTAIDESHKKLCAGNYLAAASFCSTDQFDRPTAAILHICIGDDFFMKSNLKTNILVVRHELGHALGFNAISLAHFRRPNGQPYTDRDPRTGEIPITEVNCTGPISSNRTGLVALPSSEVLQFRVVRGGVRVAEIVTPSVRQVARNHFDCQTLPGAELESGEFLPLSTNPGEMSCIGDHWERRLFKTDLMNPWIDDNVEFTTRFSTITLAYFADSGWYQIDLSRATTSAGWGRAAGCDFVEQTCVNADDGQVPSSFDSFFCNQIPAETAESGYSYEIHGCTTDLTKKATCSIGHVEGEIPQAYQYFNFKYGANVGGADPYMDFCPVYSGFMNGLCSDSQNEAVIKINYIERFGQRNSRCLSGKITTANTNSAMKGENSTELGESATSTGSSTESTTALCLPIACVVEDRTLRIQVNGVWMVCHYKDEVLTPVDDGQLGSSDLPVNVASIVCPDPIRVCPTFYCHRDCLGTSRVCDYNVGKCVCSSYISVNASSSDFKSWDGKSFANSNETNTVTCSSPKEVNDTTDNSRTESFYEPEQSDIDEEFPASDSPLSDYYYKSERYLKEESSNGFWNRKSIGLFSGICALVFFTVTSYISRIVRVRHGTIEVEQEFDGSGRISRLDNETFNPNKDKLMASVVVNLRMNDTNLQRLNRTDPLSSRDSETDTSMTDTDGASDILSSLDLSLELSAQSTTHNFAGTIVDLAAHDNAAINSEDIKGGGLYDDVDIDYVDPLAPPSVRDTKANVRRRRHIFAQLR